MRLVVDAMCAEYGGIRTFVEHLLARWTSVFPGDELHVAVPAGSDLPTAGHRRHEIPVRSPSVVGRPLAQTTAMRSLVRGLVADAVLATAPTTSVLGFGTPLVAVVLDLRHELRPDQFSRPRRLLRDVSYGRTYALADAFVAISQRSLDDLHELHPATAAKPGVVAHLGADHVLGWPAPTRTGPAVAFAHHTNKNPTLVLDAWAELVRRGDLPPPLRILGVGGARREPLEGEIAGRGLSPFVEVAPFLPDEEFQKVISSAEMVVFPSDFEGFGLPTVEGMALGKPVVIGPEKACLEVAGGHAVVMGEWSPVALADAVARARTLDPAVLDRARDHAAAFTWERTVRQVRSALVAAGG